MKKLLLSLLLVSALPVAARTFTSADGTKTMDAELISYNASRDTVVLKLDGKHSRTTASADSFSKADQEYFMEFLKESEKLSALNVDADKQSDDFEITKGLYSYEKKKESFKVSLANKAAFPLENLTAKYDIYVSKFDSDGKKVVEVVSGEESIEEIANRSNTEFQTSSVEINIDCSTSSSCPKCAKQAASVQRERIIGIRVSVYGGENELLIEYHSSNSTRSIAEEKDQGV